MEEGKNNGTQMGPISLIYHGGVAAGHARPKRKPLSWTGNSGKNFQCQRWAHFGRSSRKPLPALDRTAGSMVVIERTVRRLPRVPLRYALPGAYQAAAAKRETGPYGDSPGQDRATVCGGQIMMPKYPRRTRQETFGLHGQRLRRPPHLRPMARAMGRKAVFSSTGRSAFSFAKTKENALRRFPRHQPGYLRKTETKSLCKESSLTISQFSAEAVVFFSPAWDSRHFRPEYRFWRRSFSAMDRMAASSPTTINSSRARVRAV